MKKNEPTVAHFLFGKGMSWHSLLDLFENQTIFAIKYFDFQNKGAYV